MNNEYLTTPDEARGPRTELPKMRTTPERWESLLLDEGSADDYEYARAYNAGVREAATSLALPATVAGADEARGPFPPAVVHECGNKHYCNEARAAVPPNIEAQLEFDRSKGLGGVRAAVRREIDHLPVPDKVLGNSDRELGWAMCRNQALTALDEAAVRGTEGLDVERLAEAFREVIYRTPGVWVDYSGKSNRGGVRASRREFIRKVAREYERGPKCNDPSCHIKHNPNETEHVR